MFKRKALALAEDLRQAFGDIQVDLNPAPPRRGSFECVIVGETEEGMFRGLQIRMHNQKFIL